MKQKISKSRSGLAMVLRSVIAHHMLLTAGIVLTVVGAVVTALLPPLVLERAVNLLTSGSPVPFSTALLYFMLIALTGILESARESLLIVFGQKITHGLRSTLCGKLSKLPADAFVRQEPGAVVSRFVGDVDTIESLFTSGIISMFADGCRVVSIFVILFLKNTGLTIVLLILLPFIFVFTRAVQKRMLTAQIDNRIAVGRVTSHVPETIRCIRTIHALQKETYMRAIYDRHIQDSYNAVEKTNFYDAVYSPVILTVNALVVAVIMLLSATGVPKIQSFFGMSVGTAVAVIAYIGSVFGPLESIGMEIQTIQSAVAGVRRIDEFLRQEERWETDEAICMEALDRGNVNWEGDADLESDSDPDGSISSDGSVGSDGSVSSDGSVGSEGDAERGDAPGCADLKVVDRTGTGQESAPCVELRNVDFGYGDAVQVLHHVNFQVETGEQVTLAGRTGAGKSTIFKLLLGQYRPDSGAVLLYGHDAALLPDRVKRSFFGYVEQSFRMVPGTVLDQITLFDETVSREMAAKAAKTVGLHETILGLTEKYDTPCTHALFSQGQWQLLSIARAIAAEPKLLLLDEITANLDAETEQTVLAALKKAGEHRTVISISHRLYQETGGRQINLDQIQES